MGDISEYSAHLAVLLVLVMLAAMVSAPVGYRLRLWSAAVALTKIVALGLVAGALAALAALVALFSGAWLSSPAIVLTLVVIVVAGAVATLLPLRAKKIAERAPIKDITTDTANPPSIEAALPARARDVPGDTGIYEGAGIAAIQRQNYPDIAPVSMASASGEVFPRALAAAKRMGWTILAADPARGRIEASDRTRLFGFVDDIVVRLTPEDAGTRIDMRSTSRVGVSDLGKNAARIRAYFAAVSKRSKDVQRADVITR